MQIILLIAGMTAMGLIVGWLAGLIWKEPRPFGVVGDYLVAIVTAIVIGLIDWFVIPAMGFSDGLRNLGVVLEPPAVALLVLWLIRRSRR